MTRTGGRIAVAGPILTLSVMIWLHVAFPGTVDPMNGVISDYASVDTAGPLFALGVLSLAAGTAGLTYALARIEPARSAAARVLLAGVSVALALTALFPTDPSLGVGSATGEIHRWSTALVFTGLPCAGWILARQTRTLPGWRPIGRVLNGLSLTSVAILVVFLLTHPGSPAATLTGVGFYGLVERMLIVSEVVLVLAMAAGATRVRPPRTGPATPSGSLTRGSFR
ncbi:DUF998 domain-containing protein [Microtetraspora sp. NBRC 16547]|uniref:DUF998 domain-containing protein n=1 Tax=Microtetraspora sp. NBRC 16547 TaxID=3030993 RepID=UPI0024A2CC7C|nr:DUF998 domain-containing protein [Microtetraspora sp. NBRC 16547]GLX02814.1 hypothetical protein Misp02_69000 [Microtetraspora sp. NBRC 16547]